MINESFPLEAKETTFLNNFRSLNVWPEKCVISPLRITLDPSDTKNDDKIRVLKTASDTVEDDGFFPARDKLSMKFCVRPGTLVSDMAHLELLKISLNRLREEVLAIEPLNWTQSIAFDPALKSVRIL